MIFKLRTAPVIQSDVVRKLDAIGKTNELIEAIEAERKNSQSNTGSSANGQIRVERVGSYGNKKGR